MPVRKFRSVEEMSEPVWRKPSDPSLYRAIASVWAFGRRTTARRFPPGVTKHASIEEMSRAQDAWDRTNAPDRRS